MVTQDNSAVEARQPSTENESQAPLQVEDSTPPEVLEQERQVLELGADVPDTQAAEQQTDFSADEVSANTEVQPAIEPLDQSAVQQPNVQAEPRTYSQDEFEKMQSSFGKQVAEAQRAAQEAAEKLDAYDVSAEVEARVRQHEAQLVPLIGQEEASKIARNPEQVRQTTEAITAQRQLQQVQIAMEAQGKQTEEFARMQVVQLLAREYSLTPEQSQSLLVSNSPEGMEILAKQFAPNNSNSVPPETQATQLGVGRSSTAAPPNQQRITQSAMNKPATQWSDSEYEALRRAAWGE